MEGATLGDGLERGMCTALHSALALFKQCRVLQSTLLAHPTSDTSAGSYSTRASCSVSDTAVCATPGSAARADSTLAEQALQVMPPTRSRVVWADAAAVGPATRHNAAC